MQFGVPKKLKKRELEIDNNPIPMLILKSKDNSKKQAKSIIHFNNAAVNLLSLDRNNDVYVVFYFDPIDTNSILLGVVEDPTIDGSLAINKSFNISNKAHYDEIRRYKKAFETDKDLNLLIKDAGIEESNIKFYSLNLEVLEVLEENISDSEILYENNNLLIIK